MTDIDKLLEIMQQLRDPETGCPWDRQQTFESIIPYTLEEVYEVQDAILNRDMGALCDELGDLLLQVVYHAQMAKEQQRFDFQAVVDTVSEKMVRRHPHVFGDEKIDSPEQLKKSWEQIKQQEKKSSSQSEQATGVLSDVLKSLPALKQAQKLQNKAANVGFDWPEVEPVFDKIAEECQELRQAMQVEADKSEVIAELGDLIFSLVNLARHLGVDAEIALMKSNRKFTRRFEYIESELLKQNRRVEDCSLTELDSLWDSAKQTGL